MHACMHMSQTIIGGVLDSYFSQEGAHVCVHKEYAEHHNAAQHSSTVLHYRKTQCTAQQSTHDRLQRR